MGNADSTYFSTVIDSWKNPDLVPKVTDKPKHEPNYGFAESRAERVAKASEEDMYYARIPANRRDYCGNLLIDLQRCKRENYPFVGRCEHYVHEWNDCQNEDVTYRMKEFERERRLLKRDHRKKLAAEKESLDNLE